MKVVLSCAGTGGHIYPAIAIADKIRERRPDAEILFIGTKTGMENLLVPNAGYEIRGISAKGLNRRNLVRNVETAQAFFEGNQEARAILNDFAPDIVIGTGGYVTVPVILNAHFLKMKTCIHEQNAYPGFANKYLSEVADNVFISFDGTQKYFSHRKRITLTGNPIRSAFSTLDRTECRRRLGIPENEVIILLFGGSLGAELLNRQAIGIIDELASSGVKLYFVTGKRYYEEIKSELAESGREGGAVLIPYADNMPELMCSSDLVISRAGAIAVSEIMACGKPSILVPSPNVTHNHQYYNAKAVADAGAALLVEESSLKDAADALAKLIRELAVSPERLSEMAENTAKVGKTNAADLICDVLKI